MVGMARIPLLDPDDPAIPEDARAVLTERLGSSRRVSNITRVMANNPNLARAFSGFVGAFYRNGVLTPKERELTYTTATTVNQCFY